MEDAQPQTTQLIYTGDLAHDRAVGIDRGAAMAPALFDGRMLDEQVTSDRGQAAVVRLSDRKEPGHTAQGFPVLVARAVDVPASRGGGAPVRGFRRCPPRNAVARPRLMVDAEQRMAQERHALPRQPSCAWRWVTHATRHVIARRLYEAAAPIPRFRSSPVAAESWSPVEVPGADRQGWSTSGGGLQVAVGAEVLHA